MEGKDIEAKVARFDVLYSAVDGGTIVGVKESVV